MLGEKRMKEIPIAKARANKIGIVITLLIAINMQQPWLIAIVWLVQVLNRLLGSGANAFVIILEPIAKSIYGNKRTESEELQKFNLSLGLVFLSISLICFSLQYNLAGYIFAGMMACAALAALCGYCIGCTIYFQYKKYKALKQKKSN